jgi:hypothetical protein
MAYSNKIVRVGRQSPMKKSGAAPRLPDDENRMHLFLSVTREKDLVNIPEKRNNRTEKQIVDQKSCLCSPRSAIHELVSVKKQSLPQEHIGLPIWKGRTAEDSDKNAYDQYEKEKHVSGECL